MNHTPNFNLPQWVSSDRIRMDDFNDAMSAIDSGLAAAYTPDNKPYVVGSYTGNGRNQHIDVPFKPSMVIVSGMNETSDADSLDFLRYFAIVADNTNAGHRIQLFADGFNVFQPVNNGFRSPSLNEADRHYDYIAFK